jgi:RNA polymerase sigma factor (sigma-70 family)
VALELWTQIAAEHPTLSKERELELTTIVAKARLSKSARVERARHLLVCHNIALVIHMAKKYPTHFLLDDLVQEGATGLTKAIEKFDPTKGNKFSTYATWWINAYLKNYARLMNPGVKVKANHSPTVPRPIAVSLDTPLDEDESVTSKDLLESEDPDPETFFSDLDFRALVEDRLRARAKKFGPIGMRIIRERLMQHTEDQTTLEAMGDDVGLSRERIRQIEVRLRPMLRDCLRDIRALQDAV